VTPALLHALSVGLTLVLLLAGYHVLQRLIDRLVQQVAARQRDTARSRTLGSLLTSVVRWVLAFVVLVLILRELGVDVHQLQRAVRPRDRGSAAPRARREPRWTRRGIMRFSDLRRRIEATVDRERIGAVGV